MQASPANLDLHALTASLRIANEMEFRGAPGAAEAVASASADPAAAEAWHDAREAAAVAEHEAGRKVRMSVRAAKLVRSMAVAS